MDPLPTAQKTVSLEKREEAEGPGMGGGSLRPGSI